MQYFLNEIKTIGYQEYMLLPDKRLDTILSDRSSLATVEKSTGITYFNFTNNTTML